MSQTIDHPAVELPEIPVDVTAEQYADILEGLSQASVDRHFDAFIDVPWDHPDFEVLPDDPRWVLPSDVDPLGAHPWYQSQSLARQIEIGQWRQANILKVGLQFENILIRGIMQYVFTLPNGSPEYRYLTHEATEECHHTQMFQETVNRIGVDVVGMPWLMRKIAGLLPWAGSAVPFAFFIGVLAGEEPIDHTQKGILRSGKDLPLCCRGSWRSMWPRRPGTSRSPTTTSAATPRASAVSRSSSSPCCSRSSCESCATSSWCRPRRSAKSSASRARS